MPLRTRRTTSHDQFIILVLTIYFRLYYVASSSQCFSPDSQHPVLSPSHDGSHTPLEDLRNVYILPCLAVARSRNKALSSAVTGVRKYGTDSPVLPTDQFHLGSLTKAMTATMVAQVVKKGFLRWDATLVKVLPALSDIMDASHQNTTLRMLTSHRSGLSLDWTAHVKDLYFWWSLYDMSAYKGRWSTVSRGLTRPRTHDLGTFTYDNTNFNIAGAIIERAMNSTWEDMVQELIFGPLDMTNCGLGPSDEHSDISIDNPWPHTLVKKPWYRLIPLSYLSLKYRDNPPALNSAGRVHCPMASYAKFLQAHLDGARGLETPLGLLAEDFQILHTPYQGGDEMPYTPGAWRRHDVPESEDEYTLTHSGSNTYNEAMTKLFIGSERDELYMAMTNIASEMAGEGLQETVRELVEGRLL